MRAFPMKQTSALVSNCQEEFQGIIKFNQMMQREPGNAEHLLLQGQLLEEGAKEFLDAKTFHSVIDALCDIAVVAVGFLHLAEMGGSISDGTDVDATTIKRGGIYGLCANCHGHAFTLACENDGEANPGVYLAVAAAYAKEALWSVAAYCVTHGIDLKKHLAVVNASNLSKFCLHDEFTKTVEKYHSIEVSVDMRMVERDLYACYSLKSVYGRDGNFYPAGKLLKPVGFMPPVFDIAGAM